MSYNNQIIFPEDGGPIEDGEQQIQFYKATKKEESLDPHASIDSQQNPQPDLLATQGKQSGVPNILAANAAQGVDNPYEDKTTRRKMPDDGKTSGETITVSEEKVIVVEESANPAVEVRENDAAQTEAEAEYIEKHA